MHSFKIQGHVGSLFCGVQLVLCILSSFAMIFLRKKELFDLHQLCSMLACGCQCSVSIPCGAVGWSVTFPGHTHFLYFSECNNVKNEIIFW